MNILSDCTERHKERAKELFDGLLEHCDFDVCPRVPELQMKLDRIEVLEDEQQWGEQQAALGELIALAARMWQRSQTLSRQRREL